MIPLNMKRLFIYFVVTAVNLSAGLPIAHATLSQWGVGGSSSWTLCNPASATCSIGIEPFTIASSGDLIGSEGGSSAVVNNSSGFGWARSSITGSTAKFNHNRLQLRGAVYASDTGVVQVSNWGVDGLVYTGTESMTLTISGELSAVINNDIESDLTYLTAAIAVLMPTEVNALNTTNLQPYFGSEISPLDFSSTTLLETGSTALSVTLDLNPGDTFYLWSSLELSAAAGGSALTSQNFLYSFSDGSPFYSSSLAVLPIPAAVWMFGSAIVVLVAKSRRRLIPV